MKQNIKLKDIMNEGITSDDYDEVFNDTGLFPKQVESLIQGLRISTDLLIKVVEELKDENPNWTSELQNFVKIRNIISKSQLMKQVNHTKSIDGSSFNSAASYINNHLPTKKKK